MVMYEYIYTVLEYKSNKMIFSLHPSDMLITDNWLPIQHIKAADNCNYEKNFIIRHPCFDEVTFPFLIATGYQFITLINVKEYRIQTFVDATISLTRGQEAIFF